MSGQGCFVAPALPANAVGLPGHACLAAPCTSVAKRLTATRTRNLSASTGASGGHCPQYQGPAGLSAALACTDRLTESLQAVTHLGASVASACRHPTSRPVCCPCRHRRAQKHATGRHAPARPGGPPATSTSPPGWLPAAAAVGSSAARPPAAWPWAGSAQPTAATLWGFSAQLAAATPWAGSAQPAAARSWAGPAACPADAHAAAAAPHQ